MLVVWAILGVLSLWLGIVILMYTEIPPLENREYAQLLIGSIMVGFGIGSFVICGSQALGQLPQFV